MKMFPLGTTLGDIPNGCSFDVFPGTFRHHSKYQILGWSRVFDSMLLKGRFVHLYNEIESDVCVCVNCVLSLGRGLHEGRQEGQRDMSA